MCFPLTVPSFPISHGDDARQRSPWALATLYVSLKLHRVLARRWAGEGRVPVGTGQLWPGLEEQRGCGMSPRPARSHRGPAGALRGWAGARERSLGLFGGRALPSSGERKEAAGKGEAEGGCCWRQSSSWGLVLPRSRGGAEAQQLPG